MVIVSVVSVCLSVYICLSVYNKKTFKSLHVESSFLVCGCGYIFRRYWSSSYTKVIGSHYTVKVIAVKKREFSLLPICKTSIGNNAGSTADHVVKFACSMGILVIVD